MMTKCIQLTTVELVERAFGLFENFGQALLALRIARGPLGRAKCCFNEGAERAKKGERLRSGPLAPVAPPLSAFPNAFDSFLFTFEFLDPVGRQAIDLPAVLMFRLDQSFVLELLEGRVNRACARTIETARTLSHFFDQLVTMFRAFLEERKDRQADFAKSEKSSARASGEAGKGSPILPGPPTAGSGGFPMSLHKIPVFRPAPASAGVVTLT